MIRCSFRTATRAASRPSHHIPRQPCIRNAKRHSTNSSRARGDEDPAIADGNSIPVPNTVATIPLWQRLGPLSRAFQAYGRSQRKRPYATQFVSSLVIYFCGDLSAQSISGDDYDPKRTVRALIIGAGSSIPSYKWFMFLGNHFNYSSHLVSLTTKVVVNQIVFTPIFNSYFFGMQALLSGASPQATWEHIKRTVPISAINSCKLWPAVTAFSFTFIDPQYRSVFAGVIAIGWQTYLSYLNRKAEDEAVAVSDVGGSRKAEDEAKETTIAMITRRSSMEV